MEVSAAHVLRARRELSPLAALLGAVWPAGCAGCGRPDEALCRGCARPLRERSGRVAALAGTTAGGTPPTWATTAYTGPVRETLLAWKDRDRADLTRWLVPALAEAVQAAVVQSAVLAGLAGLGRAGLDGFDTLQPLVLVPVPSRRAAVRQRGRDVVADLARGAAGLLRQRGMPVLAVPALRQGRRLRDQAGLDAGARAGNLAGALRAAPRVRLQGVRVVLVDDVVTTGSTLAEAARVLRASEALVLAGAVVAATPRRGRDDLELPA